MSSDTNAQDQTYDFDILVIGSGPGGYECAIRSAQLGFKTCVVEKEKTLGGVCLNWGCIPTKSLLKNAEVVETLKRADEFGIKLEGYEVDFTKVVRRSRKVATKMAKGVEFLMKKNKITVKKGFGKLLSNQEVEITYEKEQTTETVKARHIILATGTKARSFPSIEVDRARVITSTEAMTLSEKPHSLTIIGAGAIGVEFAYFYNAMGTSVTLIELLPQILPNEDHEVSEALIKEFKKKGIEILTEAKVEKTQAQSDKVLTTVNTKDGEKKVIESDYTLVAIGLTGNIDGIGLEEIGVETEKGFIKTDDFGRTNIDNIYAIGDVAGGMLLAHKASVEGINCVEKIAGQAPEPLENTSIPACTYCQPSVAHLGLTEKEAIEKGYEIKIGKFPFMASGKATAAGANEGFVKLIFDKKLGELLGAHIFGHDATELIAELGLAKKMEATSEWIHKTVHAHPTLSEAVKEAAAAADDLAINM